MSTISVFDLTVPCDKVEFDQLKTFLVEHCKAWAFQKEKGEETGYEHYQARVSVKTKKRLSTMITLVNKDLEGSHVSATCTQNMGNEFYVLKAETRVEGPWSDRDKVIPRHLRDTPAWYPWQKHIVDNIDRYEERTIHVIVDLHGNQGKSLMSSWLAVRGLAGKIPIMNDMKDVMRMVMNMPKKGCYFIDIPRAIDQKAMHNFYAALEELKNGHAFDDRYHFQEDWFDPPQIWVFTNSVPQQNWLSKDRWRLHTIINKELTDFKPNEDISLGASL